MILMGSTNARWMRGLVLSSAGVLILLLAGWGVRRHLTRQAEIDALEDATARLQDAHDRADSCAITLGWEQERFLHFDSVVDSLRLAVRNFEDADGGGVPEAEYPEYLAVFDAYNDSVAVWQTRADAVQAAEATCRAFAEAHNALRDSIQARFGTGQSRDP